MNKNSIYPIEVNEQSTLSNLQQLFNEVYPYLKISFYTKSFDPKNNLRLKLIDQTDKNIISFLKKEIKEVRFLISANLSVSQLNQIFLENIGLNVLVHRNSGRLWLQINDTDSWSLEEQNKQGQELCT